MKAISVAILEIRQKEIVFRNSAALNHFQGTWTTGHELEMMIIIQQQIIIVTKYYNGVSHINF